MSSYILTDMSRSSATVPAISRAVLPKGDFRIVRTFPAKGKFNPAPRGNCFDYALGLTVGIRVEVAPFVNPNKKGRGGVAPYLAERLGAEILEVELKGDKYLLLAEEEARAAYLDLSRARKVTPASIVARALRDYREVLLPESTEG